MTQSWTSGSVSAVFCAVKYTKLKLQQGWKCWQSSCYYYLFTFLYYFIKFIKVGFIFIILQTNHSDNVYSLQMSPELRRKKTLHFKILNLQYMNYMNTLSLRIRFIDGNPSCFFWASCKGLRKSIFFLLARTFTDDSASTKIVSASSYPNSHC